MLEQAGGPLTGHQIPLQIKGRVSYSNVMKVLERLRAQGRVSRYKNRRFHYTVAIDRTALAAQRMHDSLNGRDPYGRADVLIAFVEQLSEADAETLRRHLTRSLILRGARPSPGRA